MSEALVGFAWVNVTCAFCKDRVDPSIDREVSLDRRRLAEVRWRSADAKAQVYISKKLNKEGVGRWAMPGQLPGTRVPAKVQQQENIELVPDEDDEMKEVHCRGCGGGFSYRRAEWAGMAGRSKKKGAVTEHPIRHNLGRPSGLD